MSFATRLNKLTDTTYSPTNPSSESAIRTQVDDSIQEVYSNVVDVLASVDADDSGAESVGTEGTFGSNNVADEIKAIKVITDAKAEADGVYLKTETYSQDEIDTLDSANVKLTGAQTITDVKTFSSSPIVPETPTSDTQASSKGYVDTLVSDVVLGQIPDNSLTEIKQDETVKTGQLSALTTTEKGTFAGAINEVDGHIDTNTTNLEILRVAETDTGVADAYVVNTAGTFSRTDGNILPFIPSNANTGASTINEDGNGIASIKKWVDGVATDLEEGDLPKYQKSELVWNTSNSVFMFAPKGGANTFDNWDNTINSYRIAVTATMTEVVNVTGSGWLDIVINRSSSSYAVAIEIDGVFVTGSTTTGQDVSGQLQCNHRFETSLKIYTEHVSISAGYRLGDDYKTATPVFYVSQVSSGAVERLNVTGSGWIVAIDGLADSKLYIDGVQIIDTDGSSTNNSTMTLMYRYETGFVFDCQQASYTISYVSD